MSFRRVNSPAISSLPSVTALNPIVEYPASTPSVTSCFVSPVAYRSCIVNGARCSTFALPSSISFLAFSGVVGIRGSPRMFMTGTLKSCPLLPERKSTSELLKEVFESATLSITPDGLFNNGSQLLRTGGASVGVLVCLSFNFCIVLMPPNQPGAL